jgi:Raf kinase inhibitor-like YbhB/YbcL family protein
MLIKILCLLLIFSAVLLPVQAQFQISSTAFSTGENIPEKYTAFKGSNINPPLKWINKPAGTQSFLLVMYDRTFCSGMPDSICRSHWVVKDIPSAATSFDEGTSSTGPLPAGALLGKSDNAIRGLKEYTGPFPDSTTIHLYEFKLYALNVASLDCVTPYYNVCLQRAMTGKVLGTASLFGYYLPRPLTPLPVNFVTVEALCSNGKINCNWSTAAESADAQTFTIQRSYDGNNFISIGSIPCTGNTTTLHEYHFTDSSNNSGGYYRIKQTDKDGRFMYSYIAYGKCSGTPEETLTVLPNPSPDKFIISFNNPKNKQLQVVIYDMLGKEIARYKSTQQNGTFTVLANNAPGNYLMKASFNDGKDFITQKLLKLK